MKKQIYSSVEPQSILKNYLHALDLDCPLSSQLDALSQFLKKTSHTLLNFNEVLSKGHYQGCTILQVLIIFAYHPGIYSYLTMLLQEDPAQLDFGYSAKEGMHQGKNAFALIVEHFCFCTLRDEILFLHYAVLLKTLITAKIIEPQNFNEKFERGIMVNKSILACLILKNDEFPEIMNLILQNYNCTVFNFQEKINHNDAKSRTLIEVFVESTLKNQIKGGIISDMPNHIPQENVEENNEFAFWIAENVHRHPQLIRLVIQYYDLAMFNFNARNVNGATPLFVLTLNVLKNLSLYELFISFVKKIPHRLDFNITITMNGESKMTLFNLLCCMCNVGESGCDKILSAIFNAIPHTLLDYNAKCEGGPEDGRTPLWFITKLAANHPLLLQTVINQKNKILDFNTQDKTGITPLWNIVLAAQKEPELLQKFLQHIPLKALNFSIRTQIPDLKDLNMIEWMKDVKELQHIGYYLAFVNQLEQVRQRVVDLSDIPQQDVLYSSKVQILHFHLTQLEYHAKVAEAIHPEFQLQIVLLYEELGLQEKLQNLIQNISKNNPYIKKIVERLNVAYSSEKEALSISPETNDPNILYEAFQAALTYEPDNSILLRALALNYVYNKSKFDANFAYDPMIDNLTAGKQTSLCLIETERKRVKLQSKIVQATAENKMLQQELYSLKSALGR